MKKEITITANTCNKNNATDSIFNEVGDRYTLNLPVPKDENSYATNKKRNIEYWDMIENEVEQCIKTVARYGGINVQEFEDLVVIKEVTECIIGKVCITFKEADYPYIDENF